MYIHGFGGGLPKGPEKVVYAAKVVRRHRYQAIVKSKVQSHYLFTDEHFRLWSVMRKDKRDMKTVKVIKLSQVTNDSSAIVGMDISFVNSLQALVKDTGSFGCSTRCRLWIQKRRT